MADTTAPQDTTVEERNKRIEQNTSFGKYTMKQLFNTAVQVAGFGGGWLAGNKFKDSKPAKFIVEKAATMLPQEIAKHAFMGTTIALGAMASTVPLAYEHWKNAESEKLAVNEINKDVSNLVEQRGQFADTLSRQEAMIKNLVAERQASSQTERVANSQNAAATPSLG